jgi:demethylmenaquinone methyltransferase/2-methoxy-6-polyprenyl-1,4-benzoquinol methylase
MDHTQNDIAPVNRPRAEAATAYDRMSPWYDLLTGSSEKRYRKAGLAMLEPKKGERILEVGCGTGHSAVFIARAVTPGGYYTAIDISGAMLHKTAQRIAKAGLGNSCDLIHVDACSAAFAENHFDAVFMSFTLELLSFDDMILLLRNLHSFLQPGGRLVIVSMSKAGKPGVMVRLYEWMHRVFPAMVDCRPVYIEPLLSECNFQLHQHRQMSLAGIPVEVTCAVK